MSYNFSNFKSAVKTVEDWVVKEFGGIRTGRATPAILDNVSVEVYGSRMPIKQVASVSIEDPRTLRIAPYDNSQIKAVEKSITAANLGLSVSSDERGLRVAFPELTSERRTSLLKVAKEKLEQAKVSIRKHRDESVRDVDEKEKKKEISEDDKFRSKAELQKLVDEANRKMDELYSKKEKEVSN
ncbi:MAG: ribosome recycling factor [Candidatus Taylorbacteria bacterium RIFCSPLOWO2_02_FULL_43_11]|uniref:Ribosome recycling factor n=1 Tax=Candidatus Taylorbacteria bacterium RIFCSPHIGHO2_02_FULL_43_32b TaxID=1802306 RepID=A0A1G2MI60_9BACT|nr:MAG: ribosome recycling factor [Candidatus Taylorbacteria bacterium RIFCSPHIGHO2_01_FULL_43_47]OHA23537.1 MAG: ribosome recycling factor [Candidatus Taylorbacteria bacterium RIFCSPHIGHO2_02_FULL_43_32b]OHA30539.1 MAG: ribosome recycling factor [Candidatus Taylorbacteria bacterium RIFCSPLOWO2_01_FULL_43_44]OHA37099.1 MAG: ribosome recycling factor [Candidatus Taylorbacteria bacterium RIFCSPLOWO2_02_FULL_43_11]